MTSRQIVDFDIDIPYLKEKTKDMYFYFKKENLPTYVFEQNFSPTSLRLDGRYSSKVSKLNSDRKKFLENDL